MCRSIIIPYMVHLGQLGNPRHWPQLNRTIDILSLQRLWVEKRQFCTWRLPSFFKKNKKSLDLKDIGGLRKPIKFLGGNFVQVDDDDDDDEGYFTICSRHTFHNLSHPRHGSSHASVPRHGPSQPPGPRFLGGSRWCPLRREECFRSSLHEFESLGCVDPWVEGFPFRVDLYSTKKTHRKNIQKKRKRCNRFVFGKDDNDIVNLFF